MYRRILVPTDGSPITEKAIAAAIGLAKPLGAQIEALAAVEPFQYGVIGEVDPPPPVDFRETQQRIATQRVQAIALACESAGIACSVHVTEAAHPYEAIIGHATQRGCDVIVMASHGRRGVRAMLLGSQTQKVLTHTAVPVLVVR
ncbi:MAG TPA: universal stress protein [Methylibium sp.]|uniref:universal stress protein n=1 Tax=Methylibium sp. TaxID=2067992 RepID=UPI002DBEFE94|nr:universal stress protein [Methylibium sp.]HEU4459779.1 universal stress protein [Methylibium sp.]